MSGLTPKIGDTVEFEIDSPHTDIDGKHTGIIEVDYTDHYWIREGNSTFMVWTDEITAILKEAE